MGYTTNFWSETRHQFLLDKPLSMDHYNILVEFNKQRHNKDVNPEFPGYWCQWQPSKDGTEIEWDGGEKFYNYEEWLEYLIQHFLEPWGYVLNGTVKWSGEDAEDIGSITVTDNVVRARKAVISY
jgi:hypothetical protein